MKKNYDKKYDRATKDLINKFESEIINYFLKSNIKNIEPVDREINLPEKHVDSAFNINDEYILHIEFQTKYEENIEKRLLLYNILLNNKFNKDVKTIIVYLADKQKEQIKNYYERSFKGNKILFEFEVIKIWELDENEIIKSNIKGMYPFLPLIKKDEKLLKMSYDKIMSLKINETEREDLLKNLSTLSTLNYKKEIINKMLSMAKVEQWDFMVEAKKKAEKQGRAKGKLQGKAEGKAEGIEEGQIKAKISDITKLLIKKFGVIPESLEKKIINCKDLSKFDKVIDSIFDIESIKEVEIIFKK